ncbi:MAG: succinyl-diaminopimelate desuccinylase [Rhodospirillaceae bacterium]
MPVSPSPLDPVEFARALIRCPSVTPEDAGALALLEAALTALGFTCHRLRRQAAGTAAVENLYARLGTGAPHLCFAGHTDVVPPGDLAEWTVDPFGAEIKDGLLYGRGAIDMKGAVAAFVAAVARVTGERGPPSGSISLLITGDEEGDATNGTKAVLPWLVENAEAPDFCLVGEPTCEHRLGDTMKIGRRGSLNARLSVTGTRGHVAYPHLADNPLPRLVRMLDSLIDCLLDEGSAYFPPSSLVLTSIDVGNPTTNVIPARATANFNIRFNTLYTPEGLEGWIRNRLDAVGGAYELVLNLSGNAFLTAPGPFTERVAAAVERATGLRPAESTGGGTSDARFIKDLCPVVEFGPVGKTMHKADESIPVADLIGLTEIYAGLLTDIVFDGPGL